MARKTSLQGCELMVWIAGSVVPLSTSCKITLSNEIADDDTKDDGIWGHQMIASKNWTITNEAKITTDNKWYNELLIDAWEAGTPLQVIVGTPADYSASGIGSNTGWETPDNNYLIGNAIIESIEYDGTKGDASVNSITIKGEGDLKNVDDDFEPPTTGSVQIVIDTLISHGTVKASFERNGTQVTDQSISSTTTITPDGDSEVLLKAVTSSGLTFTGWKSGNVLLSMESEYKMPVQIASSIVIKPSWTSV